jgi:hypothetical protein
MSKQARKQTLRQPANLTDSSVTWADVHARLDFEPIDEDFIVDGFLYCDPEDDGAPASVYSDPGLLRAWLLVHHPNAVCEGAGCVKTHMHPDYPCNGATVIANATNRVQSELVHEIRSRDPKLRITPAAVIRHLESDT